MRKLPRIDHGPSLISPVWYCLDDETQRKLESYQRKHHRRKLTQPGEPLPELETIEEIAGIMRTNKDVSRG